MLATAASSPRPAPTLPISTLPISALPISALPISALPISALLVAMMLTGCGGAGNIVARDGNAWQCGQQLREAPKSDPLLGWVSISSVDRWIAAIDRIGQRAGQFAPGSSVRELALSTAEERLAALGVKNLRWLDLMRPIHAMVQADAKNPVFGISLVLPVTDRAKAIEATAKLRTDFRAEGHDLVLDLQKANSKGTGRKPLWIHWLDHGTALATLHPDRVAGAKALGKCVETRQPRELLHVGVAVADLLARHKAEFTALQRKLVALAKEPGQRNAMLSYWSERIEQLLTETDAAILLASAGDDDVSVGVSLHAKARTDLARAWSRQAKLGANPLAAHLPADAYLVMTQSHDPMASKRELDVMLKFYTGALNMPADASEAFRSKVKEMMALMGLHSGVALFRDGRLPLGMYGVMQSKDPAQLLKVMGEVALTGFGVSLKEMRAQVPTNAGARGFLDAAAQTIGLGWGGMVDALIAKSQAWPVRFSRHQDAPAGMACEAIRMTPDRAVFANATRQMRMLTMFVPKRVDVAVCTSGKHLHVGLGPNAIQRIGAGDKAARAKGSGSVASASWYRAAREVNGETAQTVVALNPTPLLAIAAAFMPNLPEWPRGAAISTACLYAPKRVRCDLRVPVVIADFVAAMRGGR